MTSTTEQFLKNKTNENLTHKENSYSCCEHTTAGVNIYVCFSILVPVSCSCASVCVCVCVCLAVKSIEYPQNSCNLCETFIELNILLHKPYSKKFLVLRYCKTWQVQVLHCKEYIIKYDQQKLQKRIHSRIFST